MLSRIDGNFEDKPLIQRAHKKAGQLFEREAIKISSFADLYGDEVIANDEQKVARLKKVFELEKRGKIPADILEAIILQEAELSDWFGPHASTIKTSEFDDFINGVDLTVEFNEPQRSASHLALAVDGTFGATTISKKFDRIKAEIDRGELATIKYFESQNSSFKGRLSFVPRVVIGVDKEALLRLAGMWTLEEKKELAAHPISQLILLQTHAQLRAFAAYAERNGKDKLARPFANSIAIIEEVLKGKSTTSLDFLADDKVNKEILEHLSMFS